MQTGSTRNKCQCAVLCLIFALLAGCGTDAPAADVPTAARIKAAKVEYTVQLQVGEQVLTLRAAEGSYITAEADAPEGMVIAGWLDAGGAAADLERAPVTADAVYTAVLCPDFRTGVPYLFPDAHGFIRPEDTLTGAEYAAAMEALSPNAAVYDALPMPEEDEAVTKKALTELLFGLFPEDKLDNALYNLGDGQVSRAAFAKVMNTFLNRYATDKVVIGEGETLPRDLSLTSGLAEDVLTAALTYNTAEDGLPMMQAVLEMPWEPGFTLLDGWLYYADENGTLLRNGKVGTMVFGEDGRYTSGDAELDEMVAGLIAGFAREDPAADRYAILYTAFIYTRNNFSYSK